MANQIMTVGYKSGKVNPKTIMLALDKFTSPNGDVSKAQMNLVSSVAASARKILIEQFTSSDGEGALYYGNPQWASKRKSGNMRFKAGVGYMDMRGRRLIDFTARGESKSIRRKAAHLHSFPLHLWEHDAKNGHKGKWIMTVKLPPLVAAASVKHMDRIEAELDTKANASIGGNA